MSRRRTRANRVPIKETQRLLATPPAGGPSVDAGDVSLTADLNKEYVVGRQFGNGLYIHTLPAPGDDLQAEFGTEIYERMKTDPEVSASLDVLIIAPTSSEPIFTPNPRLTDPVDMATSQHIADFFTDAFNRFETPLAEIIRSAVEGALTYGSCLVEMRGHHLRSGPWAGLIAPLSLHPKAIRDTAYVVDQFNNVLAILPTRPAGISFPNFAMPMGTELSNDKIPGLLPRSKFWALTWRARNNDPRGSSVLRPAYSAYWVKQQALHEMLTWLVRFAQPSFWATVGPDAVPFCYTDANGIEVKIEPTQRLLEALQQFKNGSVLALPFGSVLNTINLTSSGNIFLDVIASANTEITRAILNQHLASNEGEHQSRASSEVHRSLLTGLLKAIKRWFCQSFYRDVLRPFTIMNFGAEAERYTPHLDVGDHDGLSLSIEQVGLLHQSNYFTNDQLPWVDRLLGLPVREFGSELANATTN